MVVDDDQQTLQWLQAAQSGDEAAFGYLVDRHRPELVLHCYRMLGRLDEAEDATQDTLLRVWRALPTFRGDAKVRTWLYRIATNTCLDVRAKSSRRRQVLEATSMRDGVAVPVAGTVPWLQALPDEVLDAVDIRRPTHDDRLTARETIELAYIAALQHLPDRQRAVFVLRDAAGWSAREVAEHLELTESAANAQLHRARTTLRDLLGSERDTATRPVTSAAEDEFVRRYVVAVEAGDDDAIAALLAADVVVSHQPHAGQGTGEVAWYAGRHHVVAEWAPALHGTPPLHMVLRPLRVNRQAALATYARLPGTTDHRAFGLSVLRLSDGELVEEINLTADQFPALGLPLTLDT